MPQERYNTAGETSNRQAADRDSVSPTRQASSSQTSQDAVAAQDNSYAQRARDAQSAGNDAQAHDYAAQVRDPNTRLQLYIELFGEAGSQDAPVGVFAEGDGGVSDPLALFFMMVFYLDEFTPKFSWGDVLKTASSRAPQEFGYIKVDDSFLPQRVVSSQPTDPISAIKGQVAAEVGAATAAVQAQRDSVKAAVSTKTSGDPRQGLKSIIVWPIQNMPTIPGGLNKSVEWPTEQITTMAEPLIALNKGASAIDLELEFVYAVGLPGVGDAIDSGSTTTGNTSLPSDQPFWTAEQVMGMIYLATSLVYPFTSTSPLGSASDAQKAGQDMKGAQFPVIFLRHYSLFPFLTPFVVTAVKIEPDEGQPLIITDRKALDQVDTHLTYPAVRQVVKITLSMKSAHYYLPVFGNKDTADQLKQQTSGKTYLGLANVLLQGRV